ncbi:GNAT superfamily N-acetyltransferase [Paenarthrobacter nicotinovorans]|uniref:GNAT family N-acetyltransferase n=1 Tax=Micrococcaceae TaxID=1268 RepID=UPI000877542A|nr:MULTISPECIES: GNAT family N-acetyltransferase [Micrococcaceae]MDR6436199.1 GNAT superfamily N-acetyltransferase [Paenarthrobacter nicotinovorans]SCZ58308.1 Acetyltransferase (GNAT) family protein [Arthrobacter sp. UNCCL28]
MAVGQAFLETLMDMAWPALEREELVLDAGAEWVLRASNGVTQRANSVWPVNRAGGGGSSDAGPALDTAAGLERSVRAASEWYRRRRLPLIFQVFDDTGNAALNSVLDRQRFTRQSETRIMVRGVQDVPQGPSTVELLDLPSAEWLHVWWSVDGRGGDAELSVAHRILTACPALYAMVRDDDGVPAAVGRLALVDGWGGIYSMATSGTHRRRGYGAQVLASLLHAGAGRDLRGFWLLVTAANHGAQSLYSQAGFTPYGSYLYRQAPLKRAPGGC